MNPLLLLVRHIMLESPCYYEVIVKKLGTTTLAIVFLGYYKLTRKDNHLLLDIEQPKYGVEYNCREIIKPMV